VTQEAQSQPVGLQSLPRKQVIITFSGVMLAMGLAFIINLFIKEIPLRKQHDTDAPPPVNKTE